MIKSKTESAQEFMGRFQKLTPRQISELFDAEAGRDLVQFFFRFGPDLAKRGDDTPLGAMLASALLLGYLIRADEDRHGGSMTKPLPQA